MKTQTPVPVALLRESGPKSYIVALAASFPCLAYKLESCGITSENWDVDRWMEMQAPWSHGEKVAAVFVACVWNPGYAETMGWRFDVFEALGVWGDDNRAAFVNWAADPVWP